MFNFNFSLIFLTFFQCTHRPSGALPCPLGETRAAKQLTLPYLQEKTFLQSSARVTLSEFPGSVWYYSATPPGKLMVCCKWQTTELSGNFVCFVVAYFYACISKSTCILELCLLHLEARYEAE